MHRSRNMSGSRGRSRRGIPGLLLPVYMALSTTLLPAFTYVPPADLGEMALQSDAVILAEARGAHARERGGLLFTKTEFVVVDALSGALRPGDRLEVEVPGGEIEGRAWLVDGAPRFHGGNRYLLCLREKEEGAWIPLMLSYGVLEEDTHPEAGQILRPVLPSSGGRGVERPDGRTAPVIATYRRGALLEHLRGVLTRTTLWDASRAEVTLEESPTEGGGAAAPPGCAYFTDNGRSFRWRAFDSAGTATIRASSPGDLSLEGGGFREIVESLDEWMDISGTGWNLLLEGPTDLRIDCGSGQDVQANTVVLNDPCSDIADLDGCSGVLAFGGPLATGTHGFDGQTWITITGWIVVVNNGVGCLGSRNWRIMMAHELGHGLGFGHVDDSGALMFSMCCNAPNGTDRTCARYTYPALDPDNGRPMVDAGQDRNLVLARDTVTIRGTVSDDGVPPAPGIPTTTWRKLSGPGDVRFADASSLETEVSFSRPGAYLLGLTAHDGELLTTDTVELSVDLWVGSLSTRTFQQNASGYQGTLDTTLQQGVPAADNSRSPELSVDGDDPGGSGQDSQVLLRFSDVFGPGEDQVPPDAGIYSAELELTGTNPGDGADLYRMTLPWSDRDSWQSFDGDGIQEGVEAIERADATVVGVADTVRIDVTASLAAWSADPCANFGWVFLPRGDNGWDFFGAEGDSAPRLTVRYTSTPVDALIRIGDIWEYFKGTRQPPPEWTSPDWDPGPDWLSGSTGIGYGDGDDETLLSDMRGRYSSVYTRRLFTVSSPDAVGRLRLRLDYDDGFVAYLNGVEVARSPSLGAPGSVVSFNTLAASREAGTPEEYVLDDDLLRPGSNLLAIQVHNADRDSSDLSLLPELLASPMVLDEGSEWRIARGTVAPPRNWFGEDFDDSGWESGAAGIGYGDGDDLTILQDMQGSYLSVFCRTEFELGTGDLVDMQLTVIHDDGVALYLNGEELGRANLPAGTISHLTAAESASEPRPVSFRIPAARLRAGRNVLAASVHNADLDSSDLSFLPVLLPLPELTAGEVRCGESFLFQRGDATGNGTVDLTDAIRILGFLFLGAEALPCTDSGDVDDDGSLGVTDAVSLLNHLFLGTPPPPVPGLECGEDPTPDAFPACSTAPCAE